MGGPHGNGQNLKWRDGAKLDATWLVSRALNASKVYAELRVAVATLSSSMLVLKVLYEELQSDVHGTMRRVADFLSIPPTFDTDRYSNRKIHGEDLQLQIHNYDEVLQYIINHSPCLLPMLIAREPRVFQPCYH